MQQRTKAKGAVKWSPSRGLEKYARKLSVKSAKSGDDGRFNGETIQNSIRRTAVDHPSRSKRTPIPKYTKDPGFILEPIFDVLPIYTSKRFTLNESIRRRIDGISPSKRLRFSFPFQKWLVLDAYSSQPYKITITVNKSSPA